MSDTIKTDTFGCLENTIKVASGHYVDLWKPDPASIEIGSIAAALGKICRFGGHCPNFYSVAEHCVHATALAERYGFTGEALQAVLLHDAAEAYVGDMVKPLKNLIPQYVTAEKQMEEAIQIAFRIDFEKWSNVVKRFDRAMLKVEKVTMWPEDRETWQGFSDITDEQVNLLYWGPMMAEAKFLAMAEKLGLSQ